MFLLSGVRLIYINTHWVWRFLLIGVGIAFLLELVYAGVLHPNWRNISISLKMPRLRF